MATLRIIKRRIKSVGGIRQITGAMEMVSATKLKKALERVEHARLYFDNMDKIVARLTQSFSPDEGEFRHPLMKDNPPDNDIVLVAVGSDKGLCSSFNSNIIREVWKLIDEQIPKESKFKFSPSPGDLDVTLTSPKGESISYKGRIDSRNNINPTKDDPILEQVGQFSGRAVYKPADGPEQVSEIGFNVGEISRGSKSGYYYSNTDGVNFPVTGSLKLTRILNDMNFSGKKLLLLPVGKKIYDVFSKLKNPEMRLLEPEINLDHSLTISELNRITRRLTDLYLIGKVSKIYILFTEYINAGKQKPKVEQFLPLGQGKEETEQKGMVRDYIFEPSPNILFMRLIPAYVRNKIFKALSHSITSEHAIRMIAMRNATDNATDLIDTLTLKRNKARQAAITKELSEIVGGAEALKG
jgi:F0F1-type ATP synthase gamma subunit